MKRCPTCNKTFTDQSLSYCIDDGTPLVSESADDEVTEFGRGRETDWNPPAYQPPSYVAPGTSPKRRTWPWVVGIIGVLVLAMIGFGVAAVVFIPRVVKKANPITVSNSNSNTSNTNSNTNAVPEKSAETNSNKSSTPPPTDKEIVLAQLRDIENDWTIANVNADKKKLDQILGEDFVWQTASGKVQGKAEYIDTIQRDTSIQKWEFEDLRLTLRGDRATLLGKVRFTMQDREDVYDFVDRFVWRDSRWQATGSEVTPSQ